MLCDKTFPSRLKGKVQRVAIRLTLLYETEYCRKDGFRTENGSYRNAYVEVDVWVHNDRFLTKYLSLQRRVRTC